MNIRFIRSSEKKKITEQLKEQFGISELPYLLIEGKEKIRAFSGHLSKEEIMLLSEIANIEVIGSYLIKKESDLRLSLDATMLLKDQISKNIINLSDSEFQDWIRGYNLQKEAQKGTLIIKYKEDFIGCGKSTGSSIINHVPKGRRLKTKLNVPQNI